MRLYRFDTEAGHPITRFGSERVAIIGIARVAEGDVQIGCMRLEPGGRVGAHQATTRQLFLVVRGAGWVRGPEAEWTPITAAHPDRLARIHAEMDEALAATGGEITLDTIKAMRLLGAAVEEAGRLHSPVGNVPRGVVKDYTFGGYHVPAGTRVLLSLAACHRLPEVFAKPDEFDPDRFLPPREEDKRTPYSLVTFGGGPRICIGINFAQVEVKAMAAHILRRYALTPVPDQLIAHVYYSPVAALINGLRLRVAPRAD